MNISVIGSGYVGLVVGTCLADLGNDVFCVDVDEEKIEKLSKGIPTIYEPGLEEMLKRNLREKRLNFTTNMNQAVQKSEAIFIAVGTPPGKDHQADLTNTFKVAEAIGKYMDSYKVIITKSTVPVGTGKKIKEIIKKHHKTEVEFDVVSNPEFLREGEAINDFLIPDRIVIGTESKRAKSIMEDIYKGIARTDRPMLFTDIKSAELIKYASNAMLATRISFMNEIARLCEKVGADVKLVAKGMGLDKRIGSRFLQAGLGYGGSCFPKDVKALMHVMKHYKVDGRLLEAVEEVNYEQKRTAVKKLQTLLDTLKDKTIAIWGLAFKPKTDDMREAPSIVIINELSKHGAKIKAFDPEAEKTAKDIFSDINIEYSKTPYDALNNADALIIVTEWNVFRDLDKKKMLKLMKAPNIVDGRNVYEPEEMRKIGFNYIGIGRSRGDEN